MEREWDLLEVVALPRWPGFCDALYVFRRRERHMVVETAAPAPCALHIEGGEARHQSESPELHEGRPCALHVEGSQEAGRKGGCVTVSQVDADAQLRARLTAVMVAGIARPATVAAVVVVWAAAKEAAKESAEKAAQGRGGGIAIEVAHAGTDSSGAPHSN